MSDGVPSGRPHALQQLMVLAGLTGFAISQPLLSVLGDNPTTLAVHGIEGIELVGLAAVIALVPPLLLWGLVRLTAAISPPAGRALLVVLAGVLVGLTVIQVAKSAGVEQRVLLVLVSAVAGVAFAVAYARVAAVSIWASYTAILPVLAMVFFLAASPASALLTTVDEPAPTAAGGGDEPSVVMIILDELPTRSLLDEDEHVDRARFPHLAAFADDATWYRHHTALASQTAAAVPSLLSGMLPTTDAPLAVNHPDNLFTLLAPTHELEVLESATQLCPYESCDPTSATTGDVLTATAPDTGDLLDLTAEIWVDRIHPGPPSPPQLDDFAEELRPADAAPSSAGEGDLILDDDDLRATSARADSMIQSFAADKGPALYFLHLLLPHQPWRYHPDGELYAESDALGLGLPEADKPYQFSWSPWVSAVSEQRHLLQLAYADQIVGQVMAALDDAGLYDDSLVIVASDHGVSFEPRTVTRSVDASTTDAIAYAPLLVKAPGQTAGTIDDANVMSIDVVPTIADVLDIDLPWDADGSAAGAAAITARGPTKRIDDFEGLSQMRRVATIHFDDDVTFPLVGDGTIGPLTRPTDPLSGLVDHMQLADVIGQRLDDLAPTGPQGVVRIPSLAELQHPSGRPLLGLVTGRVGDAPPSARFVIAVNGRVVGGSELSTDSDGEDGRILVLLPQGVLGAENEIRAALVDGDQVIELNVE